MSGEAFAKMRRIEVGLNGGFPGLFCKLFCELFPLRLLQPVRVKLSRRISVLGSAGLAGLSPALRSDFNINWSMG